MLMVGLAGEMVQEAAEPKLGQARTNPMDNAIPVRTTVLREFIVFLLHSRKWRVTRLVHCGDRPVSGRPVVGGSPAISVNTGSVELIPCGTKRRSRAPADSLPTLRPSPYGRTATPWRARPGVSTADWTILVLADVRRCASLVEAAGGGHRLCVGGMLYPSIIRATLRRLHRKSLQELPISGGCAATDQEARLTISDRNGSLA